ncbi:hypothetical protein [Kineosporia succinea]|uniref:Drug/metabolite transporter superfamily protein YnfA n=1 Tax=Kineosporia succinea TaxID=84632 RepID=A0ABT9PCV1_9ACTN|nr:hypothetical protein [Kineosporia succinea]MDP9830532.1 drug/metabolite transporter superfamily protein YnfA [Kineosporia succinea]
MTDRIVRGLWVAVFCVGTISHVADLIRGGFDVYAWAPRVLEPFYLALVVLDALVVALLLTRRRAGAGLGCVVIVLDVVANWWVTLDGSAPNDVPLIALAPLTAVGLFVVATTLRLSRACDIRTETP